MSRIYRSKQPKDAYIAQILDQNLSRKGDATEPQATLDQNKVNSYYKKDKNKSAHWQKIDDKGSCLLQILEAKKFEISLMRA